MIKPWSQNDFFFRMLIGTFNLQILGGWEILGQILELTSGVKAGAVCYDSPR